MSAIFDLRGPFGKRVVGVVGGRASVDDIEGCLNGLAKVDGKNRTTSQLFDASQIAGKEHLIHAARLALIAHSTGRNFAESLNIELVCWVAAERQIGRAFEKVGVRKGGEELVVLTVGTSRPQVKVAMAEISRELRVESDDAVLELKPKKIPILQKTFSISQEELEVAPLQKLVLERVALLALAK